MVAGCTPHYGGSSEIRCHPLETAPHASKPDCESGFGARPATRSRSRMHPMPAEQATCDHAPQSPGRGAGETQRLNHSRRCDQGACRGSATLRQQRASTDHRQPLASQLARVDVRSRPAQEVAVPQQDARGRILLTGLPEMEWVTTGHPRPLGPSRAKAFLAGDRRGRPRRLLPSWDA